ncbi:MAG: sensor domain-containing diguanylate cyclase [Nocardioidaceae bacterium]|nr:sensor domain-containing diguanylate cyclase [Nocardioidaceae bacterium]MCL2613856.1 sensor domain-containing diguanylate cyclase [Nocardioidaceae bacterium]
MTAGNHAQGVSRLLEAIQELSLAEELAEVQRVARTAARDLAGCDGATVVLRDGDLCYYVDEDAIGPLWKGRRFPMSSCISGWAMLNRQHVVIPDIYLDDRIPHDAYRPTFVKSLLTAPIRTMAPIGAIGAYWADHHEASEDEVNLIKALADATSMALAKVSVHEELAREVRLAEQAQRLSTTDDLTGLLNRRGFHAAVAETLAARPGVPSAVAFLDINGLKAVNDADGHSAGDDLIRSVAETLSRSLRQADVVARMGGDEFAVVALDMTPAALADRVTAILGDLGSVGAARLDGPSQLPDALLEADARMYVAKRARLAARAAVVEPPA